jgi:hypothetical protein
LINNAAQTVRRPADSMHIWWRMSRFTLPKQAQELLLIIWIVWMN